MRQMRKTKSYKYTGLKNLTFVKEMFSHGEEYSEAHTSFEERK
jgi:hypothetical protein